MNFTTEILTYLREQYEKATGKPMVSDTAMHSSQAPFYFQRLEDNLIEPMNAEVKRRYGEGDGNELKEKMRAIRSSSAMTFNLLGNDAAEVRADSTVFLPGRYHISYEEQIPTIRHNPHKANLDAFLEGDRQLIFCEMKLTEWLFNQPGILRESYLDKQMYIYPEIYDAAKECLRQICNPDPTDYKTYYSTLTQYDAFQMFKHTLAVYNYAAERKWKVPANIRLVNCVWHLPKDAQLSDAAIAEYLYMEQTEHEEFEQFHSSVSAIRKCFAEHGIDFDILFLPAEIFAGQFEKTAEQRRYLNRYFGEHGTGRTRDDSLLKNYTVRAGRKVVGRKMKFVELLDQRRTEGNFYRIPELNYTGTSDDGRYYTEVIADMLYEEYYPDYLKSSVSSASSISPSPMVPSNPQSPLSELLTKGARFQKENEFAPGPIHWKGGQKVKQVYNPNSNRDEDNIAKRLFEQTPLIVEDLPGMEVIDYQVPVNRADHSSEGKVDLILGNDAETILGELKDPDSKETLLRAMVEVMTYKYRIESSQNPGAGKRFVNSYDHETLQPAVIFFSGEDSQPWKDYESMRDGKFPYLAQLARAWDMLFFLVTPEEEYDESVPYSNRYYRLRRLWTWNVQSHT